MFLRRLFTGAPKAQKAKDEPLKWNGDYESFAGAPLAGTGRNYDFTTSEYGAAQAYTLVSTLRVAVDTYAYAIASVPSKVIYNPTSDRANDEVVARSDDLHPQNMLYRSFDAYERTYHQPFMLMLGMNYTLYDELYTEKITNQFGYPAGLRILNNLAIYPFVMDGTIQWYYYSNPYDKAVQRVQFAPSEIAYSHGTNPLFEWRGSSIVYSTMKAINIDDNLKSFLLDFFANNARPTVIFSAKDEPTSRNLDVWARLKRELETKFKGRGGNFKTLINPMPADVKELEQPDLEKQFIINDGIRKEILTAFGIPPVLVGDTTNTTFRNAPDARKVFILTHLRDRMRMIERYISTELLRFFYPNGDYRFEFDFSTFDVLSEGDMLRIDAISKLLSHGVIDLAKSQEMNNLPIDPDLAGIYMLGNKPISKALLLRIANDESQFLAPKPNDAVIEGNGAPTLEEREGIVTTEDEPADVDYQDEAQKAAPANTRFSRITYNGITVMASPVRPSSRDDKKYMRYVRYKGEERLVHFGDPNMEIRRDNDERRSNFNARHNCSDKKDPFSAGFWSCVVWREKEPLKTIDIDKAQAELAKWQDKTMKALNGKASPNFEAPYLDEVAPIVTAALRGALSTITERDEVYTLFDEAKELILKGGVSCLT